MILGGVFIQYLRSGGKVRLLGRRHVSDPISVSVCLWGGKKKKDDKYKLV